ncbi:hypothetical protein GCM10010329_17280 [Streptomyces spiroverticillatus]|uniref:ScoMcrA-like SRA domain-containing protein n=2 Tax=Streptomyces finlayi TaxID=67296 RepID=A0A918WTF9_9ACTN|nr:hypothetical protein GCM10010329_17280 [Streptomyces spiroverticillatus]GHC81936.1 hypothetical protein GCM10010334_09760 [Streptomyces finlayi]
MVGTVEGMTSVQIKPGDVHTRGELNEMFGGSGQGGIIPSKTSDTIQLFTDHKTGKTFGYQDGWLAEEDEKGRIFEYTGQGVEGDQTLKGFNGSVLNHADDGRTLRVFVAVGKAEGSGAKRHRYVGEFRLDEDEPFVMRRVLDQKKDMRWVYVFRLRPVVEVEQAAADFVPAASQDQVETLPAVPISDPGLLELKPAESTTGQISKPEKNSKKKVTRKASDAVEVTRREAELSDRFLAFLQSQGHEVDRFKIRVKGLTSTFWTDLYDATDNVLYELKGSSSRNAVRFAIGQLHDYSRHIPPKDARLVVLLPERPVDDLAELITHAGMELVFEDGDKFSGWPLS